MIIIVTYVILSIVMLTLAYGLYRKYQELSDKSALYFSKSLLISGVGQLIGLILLSGYFLSLSSYLLYWADILGRLFLYLGAAYAIQVPIQLYFVKSKWKNLVSYAVAFYGLLLFVYGLSLNYAPIMGSAGLINWGAPFSFNLAFGIPLFIIWMSIISIFFREYVKSNFSSKKSLLVGSGFFISASSGIVQDFANSPIVYLLINLLLVVGFMMVYGGLFMDEKSNVTEDAPGGA